MNTARGAAVTPCRSRPPCGGVWLVRGDATRRPPGVWLGLVTLMVAAAVAGPTARGEPVPPIAPSPESVLVREAPRPAALAPHGVPRSVDWRPLAAIALAVAVIAGFRLVAVRRRAALPPDVFEVLGAAQLATGQSVRVVRFGPKTLLVAVSAAGCQTLAELDDPEAAAAMREACAPPVIPVPVRARPRPPLRRVAGALLAGMIGLAAAEAGADEGRANAPAAIASLPAAATAAAPLRPIGSPTAPATAPQEAPAPASTLPASPAPEAAGGLATLATLVGPRPLDTALPSLAVVGVMTIVPALLLMTTCFVRMSVVLSLVRLGLGAPQVPSNQIIAALALFLSALVMWPVWTRAWQEGVEPWQRGDLPAAEAFDRGSLPVRRWMAAQIEQGGNRDTMLFFLARHPSGPRTAASYDDVPLEALLPAFLVSELEASFAIGLRLLLPFLVIDLLAATLAVSTGLVMLPPTLLAVPLKLLAFVAADGWTLVVRSLLDSVRMATS